MAERLDRRVVRTRRRLKKALLALIRIKAYSAITVQEIIDRADVGRSTFYSHFSSKDELLLDGFREALLAMGSGRHGPFPVEEGEVLGFSRPLLEHFRVQRRFFMATLVAGDNANIRRVFTDWLAERIGRELENGGAESGELTEARAHCIAAAFLGLAAWWLEADTSLDAQVVDAIFRETVAVPPRQH